MSSNPQVAFCGDRNVAMSMSVTLRSVARHARTPVDYYFMTPEFSDQQRAALRAAVNPKDTLTFVSPARSFRHLHTGLNNSDAYYYRIGLPDALPRHSRILYLDSDLLVRADIAELWALVEQSDSPAQACYEYERYVNHRVLPDYPKYGHTDTSPYYNSGVLGMNLAHWRDAKVSDRLVEFLVENGERCPGWDQGAINGILGLQITPLPQEWNVFSPLATNETKIVHYSTWRKPFARGSNLFRSDDWKLAAWQNTVRNNPFFQEYFQVLDETQYRGWRPDSVCSRAMRLVPRGMLQAARRLRWKKDPWLQKPASVASADKTTSALS